MTVLALVVLAAGFASGLFLVGRAVFMPKTLSFRELNRITSGEGVSMAQAWAGQVVPRQTGGLGKGIGVYLVQLTTKSRIGRILGLRTIEQLTADLKVLDRTLESHITNKMFASVCGFGLPVLVSFILTAGGSAIPVVPLAFVSLILGVIGFVFPDWPLDHELAERRTDFLHTFSSYTDLVAIFHAGSLGIRESLIKSSEAGSGWAFDRIRRTLVEANHRNQDEAVALRNLGEELGIREVTDFAKAVRQASSKGAVIQTTLNERSDIMRSRLAAASKSKAESSNVKMLIPVVFLVMAFVMFIGFGLINSISITPEPQSPAVSTNN